MNKQLTSEARSAHIAFKSLCEHIAFLKKRRSYRNTIEFRTKLNEFRRWIADELKNHEYRKVIEYANIQKAYFEEWVPSKKEAKKTNKPVTK